MSEAWAKRFHETYERLAPDFGYQTREESAVPWDQVPEENRALMIAVVSELVPAIRRCTCGHGEPEFCLRIGGCRL